MTARHTHRTETTNSIRRGVKRNLKRALLAALALAATPPAHAGTDAASVGTPLTHVLATDWGMTLKSDGSGFYNDLARFTIMAADMGANYEIQPYRRAKVRFLNEQTSCLYPSNIKLLLDGDEIKSPDGFIESAPIIRVLVYVFSRPGTVPPAAAADVDGKVVAYAMGSRVPYFLRHSRADFIAVTEEVAKAQMLLSGRVDMMSAAMPDLKFVMDRLGAPLPPFNPAFALNDTEVRTVCHDTPDNRVFLNKLNKHMQAAQADGSLAAFLTARGLNPAQYMPARD